MMFSHNPKFIRSVEMAALVLAALSLAACAGAPTKAYTGPVLPAEQTALITSGFHTDIVSIDGIKVSGLSAVVPPGQHTIILRPGSDLENPYGYSQAYTFYSLTDGSLNFTAEAGHKYLVDVNVGEARPEQNKSDNELSGTGFVWTADIRDQTKQTRVASTGELPLQAEPRGYGSGISSGPSSH